MIKLKSIVVILFLFVANLNAQSSLLKTVQSKFNSFEDLTANFSQSSNGKILLAGKFYYKKDNKFRLELKNILIISNGVTTWNYNKKNNKVIISNYVESDPSMFSMNTLINVYPSKCTVKEGDDRELKTLILTPNKSDLNFKEIELWINENNLIEKIKIIDLNNQTSIIEFTDYKSNQKTADSKFVFTSPEGAKVIDLR
jgi:chaperone LolA